MSLGEDPEPCPQPNDRGDRNDNPHQRANTLDPSIEKMIYYRIVRRGCHRLEATTVGAPEETAEK
jgi:hypothetical protein